MCQGNNGEELGGQNIIRGRNEWHYEQWLNEGSAVFWGGGAWGGPGEDHWAW